MTARLLLLLFAFLLSTGWTIRDLKPVPGGTASYGYGINNFGQAVGMMHFSGSRAVYWDTAGVPYEIPTPRVAGRASVAHDLNDGGIVVGETASARAFTWFLGGPVTDLGGGPESRAFAISEANHVAGQWVVTGTPTRHYAVAWPSAAPGSPYGLGGFGGWSGDFAADVAADVPVFAGASAMQSPAYRRAFVWHDGMMKNLGTLGGNNSFARAVTVRAWPDRTSIWVVGNSEVVPGSPRYRAFVWNAGTMFALPMLPGSTDCAAHGINRALDIVGMCSAPDPKAVLWRGGVAYDLFSLLPLNTGWTQLQEAHDINESGQIVGYGIYAGTQRAFILSPW